MRARYTAAEEVKGIPALRVVSMGWTAPSVCEIVDQLERTGEWGNADRLSDQCWKEVRALARERGFYVRRTGFPDRPEEWFADRPGVDVLTGLPDWAALEAELDHHEQTTPLSIAVFDVTGLTRINNEYGKSTADGIICDVGRAFRELAAVTGEFVARRRPGGDEFVLVLPGVDDEARSRADSIALTLNQPDPLTPAYRGVHHHTETRREAGVPLSWRAG